MSDKEREDWLGCLGEVVLTVLLFGVIAAVLNLLGVLL